MRDLETGYLEIILGPMFSGKTSRLIDVFNEYCVMGVGALIVNHASDDRYTSETMCSHDKVELNCERWSTLAEFIEHHRLKLEDTTPLVVLINEGQFFSDLKENVHSMVNKYNKHVYVCGLDGDFKRQKFGEILELIPMSDCVYKLQSRCDLCKGKKQDAAPFTHRVCQDDQRQILVGSSEMYFPVCRRCYHLSNK
ncbi:thymidine kinase [Ochromonadaceae sp. CCMP2298]|nr:thymidine kinase [Ochromonadaceae sp. CCMP2298]